jgi:hypothetical protein
LEKLVQVAEWVNLMRVAGAADSALIPDPQHDRIKISATVFVLAACSISLQQASNELHQKVERLFVVWVVASEQIVKNSPPTEAQAA